MTSTRVLIPDLLVGLGALLSLLVPTLAPPRSRPGIRRWLGGACGGLVLLALVLEAWLGAAAGTLFAGGVLQDRFALFAKAAILLGLLVAVAAADWELEALPGALPFAFLAALGGLLVASAASLTGLWAGVALAVVAGVAGLSRRVRGEAPAVAEAAAREGAARAAVNAGALLLLLALALAFLMATGGAASLAELNARLAGATAVTLPTAIVCSLALGILAALALLAPLRYGAAFSPLTSPLGAGAAAGLGAGAAALGLVKLGAALAPSGLGWTGGLLAAGGGVAVVAGTVLLARPGPGRALAVLGAGQLAWVIAGVGARDGVGTTAALLLLGAAVVALAGAPVLLGGLESRGARDLVGLAGRAPARAAALGLAALSLAGLPPLAGFFGEFATAAALAASQLYWALALLLLGSLLGMAGALRVVRSAFFDAAADEAGTGRAPAPRPVPRQRLVTAGAVLLGVLLCAYGLFANPIGGLALQGAEALGLR